MHSSRWHHGAGLLLATAVTLLALGYFWQTMLTWTEGVVGVPLDDAWIHYQFARNISQGNGFSFNPGEPTPGSTAPLWTLLLAPVGLFTHDFLIPSLVLSGLFLLTAVWLSYGFAFWVTESRWAAVLAALGVGLTGRLLWAGLAGMETTAFAALSLAAVWGYSQRGLRWWVTLLFALAGQVRPEGHALFALAGLDAVVGYWLSVIRADPSQSLFVRLQRLVGRFWQPVALYVLVAAPYALFSLLVTGKPLPNTFYAKVGSAHLFSWRTLVETVAYHWQDNPVSLLLLPLGLLPLARRSRLAALWLVGLPLLTAVIIDLTWHHGRYTMPLVPFQMVAAAVGGHWLLSRLVVGNWVAVIGKNWLMGMVLSAAFVAGSGWRLPYWADMLGSNSREILDIDVALGHWLAQNTPPEALVAVDDIGAITFLSQRRVVDLNGLVSPELWPALQAAEGLPRNQQLTRQLSKIQPDYLAVFPLWRWEIATNPLLVTELHHVQTETHTIIFQQDAHVYRATWPYLAAAQPETAVSAQFGDGMTLLGYDMGVVRAGQPLALTLYWQAETAVSQSYDLFIHLVDADGELVAQTDGKPLLGLAATDVWQPGDVVRDPRVLMLPLENGRYQLRLGLYQRETGVRLPIVAGNAADNALLLEPLIVAE